MQSSREEERSLLVLLDEVFPRSLLSERRPRAPPYAVSDDLRADRARLSDHPKVALRLLYGATLPFDEHLKKTLSSEFERYRVAQPRGVLALLNDHTPAVFQLPNEMPALCDLLDRASAIVTWGDDIFKAIRHMVLHEQRVTYWRLKTFDLRSLIATWGGPSGARGISLDNLLAHTDHSRLCGASSAAAVTALGARAADLITLREQRRRDWVIWSEDLEAASWATALTSALLLLTSRLTERVARLTVPCELDFGCGRTRKTLLAGARQRLIWPPLTAAEEAGGDCVGVGGGVKAN